MDAKIIDYKVVTSDTNYGIESAVKMELANGWVPFGGVSIHMGTELHCDAYAQAMIWRQPDNDEFVIGHGSDCDCSACCPN